MRQHVIAVTLAMIAASGIVAASGGRAAGTGEDRKTLGKMIGETRASSSARVRSSSSTT